jgi:hypothetical protein
MLKASSIGFSNSLKIGSTNIPKRLLHDEQMILEECSRPFMESGIRCSSELSKGFGQKIQFILLIVNVVFLKYLIKLKNNRPAKPRITTTVIIFVMLLLGLNTLAPFFLD